MAEVYAEMEVKIEGSCLSVIFDQRAKDRSLRKVRQEFPKLKKIYWGRRF